MGDSAPSDVVTSIETPAGESPPVVLTTLNGTAAYVDPRAFGITKAAYKIGEAAEVLSISKAALFADIKAGRLRKTKRCGATLLLAPDLVSYLCSLRAAS